MHGNWLAVALVASLLTAGCLSGTDTLQEDGEEDDQGPEYVPRVIVAVPDSGINPYHEVYHRPALTEHPCTYLEGFPCDIPALELSIGEFDSYEEAYEADKGAWSSVNPGDWYWIPGTVFVAVHCENPYGSLIDPSDGHCILDEHGHGTGTTSSVLTENPDALIAFKEGQSSIQPFLEKNIPVDIFSVSWGNIAPIPGHPEVFCANHERAPLYVTAAGNDPRSILIDCQKGDPRMISVGGAYAEDDTEEPLAAKQADVVSYYCRPTAIPATIDEWRESYCGTSFSAPTVAGALSKVVLAVRQASGYTGGPDNRTLDPVSGFTISDLRDAMNRTASYGPEAQYTNTGTFFGVPKGLPLNPAAPWLQWGWGFYDGLVANATIDHVLGIQEAPPKEDGARLYMETAHGMRDTAYGALPAIWPLPADDAGSGRDAPDRPTPVIEIAPGAPYEAALDGPSDSDYYAFTGEEGDEVNVRVRSVRAHFQVTDENGSVLAESGSTAGWDYLFPDGDETGIWEYPPIELTLEHTGTYYLHVLPLWWMPLPNQYAFSIGINEDAPEPGHNGEPLPPLPPLP